MQNAVAFANNDVVTIAWSYGKRPTGCMGFAVYRIDDKGKETVLPSHAVFKGNAIKPGQTTADFPLQKFYWKDPYARLIAEKTGNRTFRYKIVPLEGKPSKLTPMTALPQLVSNEVTITSDVSDCVNAFFNRGLLSTQKVARALKDKKHPGTLLTRIADEQDNLRISLSGNMVEALCGFVDRAKSTGRIHAALYELGDEELIQKLEGLGGRLSMVLSNAVREEDDPNAKSPKKKPGAKTAPKKKKIKVDGNEGARTRLAKTAGEMWNRLMPSNHIGHNKFLVHTNGQGKPVAVLFGSTNWTSNGLCAQTNNTIVIEDASLAARYLSYWKQLAADTKAAGADSKKLQGTKLRTWDSVGKDLSLADGSALSSWFSPCTPKARGKPAGEKRPVDMASVIERINGAQHAILFLAFYPGTPSIANWSADALRKNKNLFVRGCVTNKSASEAFYYELKGTSPPQKVKGVKRTIKQDNRVIGAEAFDGKIIPKGWQKEILKAGFAIIHDKIMVIDPFADNCVVITGSHNLGHKASYDNDENLVIVEGDKKLAVAYATHVLDVYDHFSWRYQVKINGTKGADQSLKDTPDEWLDRYFDDKGEIKTAQLKFWMQAKL
jgi:phosphatidylserine/phosphatidylglycerophosphate/cardiolipin synthase-like enzyme